MPPSDLRNLTVTRRLDRVMRRERLRGILKISGVVLLILGLGMTIYPFGPSVSNPEIIPKADPSAGIALVQSLPSGAARHVGLAIALLGALALGVSALLRIDGARDDTNRNV